MVDGGVRALKEFMRKITWRVGSLLPRRVRTVHSWNGTLGTYSDDSGVGRWLFVYREFERQLMLRVMRILEERGYRDPSRGVILDVGANLGVIGLALLHHGFFERAVFVEPEPDNLRLLRENVRRMGMREKCKVIPCAVAAKDGELSLEIARGNLGDHRIRKVEKAGAPTRGLYGEARRQTIRIPARTLDKLIEEDLEEWSEQIGLVWIDIQGHEGGLLEGAGKSLPRLRVPVVMEFWPYGLERAGVAPARFAALVRGIFSSGILLRDDGVDEDLEMEHWEGLFERFPHPSYGSVLLLP